MMHAEVDGERLTAQEFGIVLHPARRRRQRDDPQRDQPRDARADRLSRAAQDLVGRLRGAHQDRRRRDRPLGDARDPLPPHSDRRTPRSPARSSHAGDKVVLFYNSANRDERVFDEPVSSSTCAAAAAASGRLRRRWAALLPRRQPRPPGDQRDVRRDPHAACPNMRITGEPDYLQSNFINGIKRLPCAWD